jgi:hypothetical protein
MNHHTGYIITSISFAINLVPVYILYQILQYSNWVSLDQANPIFFFWSA